MIETISLSGWVKITITKEDGSEYIYENENLVVTAGRDYLATRVISDAAAPMSYVAIGTGATAPDLLNTTLEAEHDRVAVVTSTTSTNFATLNALFTSASFPTPTDIVEVGIFNAAAAGSMLARFVFPVQTLDNTSSLAITWSIKLG